MKGPTRRTVLKGIASGLALGACSSSSSSGGPDAGAADATPAPAIEPPDDLPESESFPLGVSAGDLAADHGVVWAKYAGTAPLSAFAWRMQGESYVEQLGPLAVTLAE